MNNLVASRSKSLQLLIVLAVAAALLSCRSYSSGVEVLLVEGKEFKVTVRNRSQDVLVVDDRLFGIGAKSSVKVEVAHVSGTVIAPCSYLDYVATGSRFSLPPDEEVVLSVPLTTLTATRCLTRNKRYLFRVLLASGDGSVSSTDWVPFRAASLE